MKTLKHTLIGLMAILIIAGAMYTLGAGHPLVTVIQYALAPFGQG